MPQQILHYPKLTSWQQLPQGMLLRRQIEVLLRSRICDVAGDWLAGLGPLGYELDLSTCRVGHRLRIGWEHNDLADLVARPDSLPLESESLNLLVMPLVLDFTEDPHQVLREAERVLTADGYLAIVGFNPYSLWGTRHWWGRLRQRNGLWQARPVSCGRLRDWLRLLNFEAVDVVRFGGWLPWKQPGVKSVASWMVNELPGRQFGAMHLLWAKKRTQRMIPLRERWRELRLIPSAKPNISQGAGRRSG